MSFAEFRIFTKKNIQNTEHDTEQNTEHETGLEFFFQSTFKKFVFFL